MSPLPAELVRLIVGHVAADDDHIGEQWVMRRKALRRTWTPLRALTQVNRSWRAVAMSHLWRTVTLYPLQDDLYAITHLRQLVEELKHPLGARNYVQHVDLTLPRSRLGGSYTQMEEVVFIDDCLDGLEPEEIVYKWGDHTIATLARILTSQFMECPLLETLKWKGWLEPDIVLLDNLSRCHRLSDLSVDLGLVSAQNISWRWGLDPDERVKAIERPPKHKCFPALHTLEFAMDRWWPEECKCGRGDGVRSTIVSDREGCTFVEALLEYKAIPKQFKLGEHELLNQAWMVPVWATTEDLSWSASSEISKENRPRSKSWFGQYMDALDEASGLSQFLIKHIDFCEPATQESSSVKLRNVAVIAHEIYDLIQTRDELKHHRWMYYYAEWSDAKPSGQTLHTKTEMFKLANILLSKVAAKLMLL